MKYIYSYAIVDPSYPAENPQFWPLAGYSIGDAAEIGWTSEFMPDSDAQTNLLKANLDRQRGKITLAIEQHAAPTAEPKWTRANSFDQILIRVEQAKDLSDIDLGGKITSTKNAIVASKRKLVFYHVRLLKVTKMSDSRRHQIFRRHVKIITCQVAKGGYVYPETGEF